MFIDQCCGMGRHTLKGIGPNGLSAANVHGTWLGSVGSGFRLLCAYERYWRINSHIDDAWSSLVGYRRSQKEANALEIAGKFRDHKEMTFEPATASSASPAHTLVGTGTLEGDAD